MKKVLMLAMMVLMLMPGTAWAEEDAAIWKSFSKESKAVYIDGYMDGAAVVCLSNGGKLLKETICVIISNYTPNKENVISLIDSIYKKEKYKKIPLRSAIFISIGVDSELISHEAFLDALDTQARLIEKDEMVGNLLN
ncbi:MULTISPECIES: hypothetical protein [Desulfovibrio]|uniref:Uncharacterized protein n=1 Tax=Desulfovibrio desulfuricans TaxID=876 RepID=A0AA94HR53_DESDE|nr:MULTISPECIES: hypothetical protein [Desulfovibrio]ATD81156.1 hypothetical protein CNY67_07000 [Desulfovibrio sp. G11]SFW22685.1 hypothetical protein SAMN02910291_00459 [Desulfovibrio desulfuricans]SPD36776.1 Hypothetical protein DSVG11_2742 [Desulfovibrio sp. G11]